MAVQWIDWACGRCGWGTQLPVVWLQHKDSRALRCLTCGGILKPRSLQRRRTA